MSTMFFIQFAIVLVCILIGAQVGGIGLGVLGGIGLAVLAFGFHLEPTSPPIDVMLMIMAVVSAAASMQASGGLDYMIKIATRVLHRNPKYITFIAPAVTYLFTVLAGTGHVAYSVLPVIAEVSRRNGIRPSRPLTMAVIASQFAIVASPIAAAVVACVTAALLVVVMGAVPELRPTFQTDEGPKLMGMAHAIEIVMLSAAALIILLCKPDGNAITKGSVFHAGMRAVIAVFGVAWLGDTLMHGHLAEVKETVSHLVETAPWTFAFALFVLSVLVNSQGATVATLFPIGISLGIPAPIIIGTFVAVNGYFFIPNYGPIIAAIDFDSTGSTKIGRFIFNHSFMIPGLLSMAFSLVFGLLLANYFF